MSTHASLLSVIAVFFCLLTASCNRERAMPDVTTPDLAVGEHYSPELEVRRFVVQIPYKDHLLEENVYLLLDRKSKEGVIVAPGTQSTELERSIEDSSVTIKGILNTHGHFDHTGANGLYRVKYRTDVYAHSADAPHYRIPRDLPTQLITDDCDLRLGVFRVRVLHTPGHSSGSVCYVAGTHVFTGDTLFRGGIGRTPNDRAQTQLVGHIRDKLLSLPSDSRVYPGHMATTSIDAEKKNNPFLQEQ